MAGLLLTTQPERPIIIKGKITVSLSKVRRNPTFSIDAQKLKPGRKLIGTNSKSLREASKETAH